MKREIKFRGKRVDNGEWVYGYYVEPIIFGEIEKRGRGLSPARRHFEVIPETVGQFTGLHDRTGKEVFEGDILYCIDNPTGYDTGNYEVIFKSGCFYAKYSLENWPKYWIEVIGNIYENPELL